MRKQFEVVLANEVIRFPVVRVGVCAVDPDEVEVEYFRRLAEIVNLMMDAGMIVIVSARELRSSDLQVIETVLTDRFERVFTVWAGDEITTDLEPVLHLRAEDCADGSQKIKEFLQDQGVIFNPW